MSEEQQARPAIRTPDQRLRVFVSSTLAELAEERAAVARAISSLRLTPVLFELGARPHPPTELYRAYLAQSDIFIGLYWQRYGWVGPGMEISGLQDEFELSRSMPRLLYVKRPAPDREAGLTTLIESIQTEATDSYRSFRTSRELGRLVRDDLAVLLSEWFALRPAPVVGRRPRRSLPVATTSLIGRDRDIEQVARLLETPEARLVTLTGPGGIGKTRLAVAVGERLEDRYPSGVVFVPLAPITEPELMLPRIAAAVGVSREGTRAPLDALVEHLGDAPTLLLLDNLEHVVDAAPELDELLARCPGAKILATSRTVLRLRAEREYPVAPLAVPPLAGRPSFERLAAPPAVELFVDRARAVRHDFSLTEANAVAVAEICRRLDGLPLAIELAAARSRLLEPTALLARLENRLDALGTGPVDLPERQRTLRATVEWSVDLLSDAERDMLATLSVFVDGWTIEAAVGVTGRDEDAALDLLDALAGHSLVSVTAADVGPRFHMLGSVREYAAELLAATPGPADVERRHAEYFREFAETTGGPAGIGQTEWAGRLQVEDGNIRKAIRWFLLHDVAPLPHLFRILWLYWWLHDHMTEGRAWVDELLPRLSTFDDLGQAELVLTLAVTAVEVGDDDTARAAVDQIERLRGRVDDPYLDGLAQLAMSWILSIDDHLDEARRSAAASFERFRQQDEPFMSASALSTLGILEMAMGRHDDARRHLAESDEMGRRFGNNWVASGARVQLASLAVEAGRLDEARALLDDLLGTNGDIELNTHTVAFGLVAYAQLALAEADPRQAAVAMGAADGLRQRAGLRVWPTVRRSEAELLTRVVDALDPAMFKEAFAAGSQLSRREAVAIVRHNRSP